MPFILILAVFLLFLHYYLLLLNHQRLFLAPQIAPSLMDYELFSFVTDQIKPKELDLIYLCVHFLNMASETLKDLH